MKRIGVLMNLPENDAEVPARQWAFRQGLSRTNIAVDYRYGGSNFPYHSLAQELVDLDPDVLFATCGPSFWALQGSVFQGRTEKPIVFAGMIDTDTTRQFFLRNQTGYISHDIASSTKWLPLLAEMAPKITQVGVMADPDMPAGEKQFSEIQNGRPAAIKNVTKIDMKGSDDAIEKAVAGLQGNGGLIVPTATKTASRRQLIIRLAEKYKLPALYANRLYVNSGGLFSYGAPTLDLYKKAAEYVARILDGAKPSDLPVVKCDPSEFELIINLKAAKAIELEVPKSLIEKANEVIG